MTKLYPPEALSPKEYLTETCPACEGAGRFYERHCTPCGGTGRAVRHQHDAASSLTAPTDEDLRVQQLEEQLATARERARAAEAKAEEFKQTGQRFEREGRQFFDQSCRNLERAEAAEQQRDAVSESLVQEIERGDDERDALKLELAQTREALAQTETWRSNLSAELKTRTAERDALKARVEALEGMAGDANKLLQPLWTKAVGSEGYDKAEWKALERALEAKHG